VITTLRNPAAWNSRFGLNRKTKFVERPLTGPHGQLDANGNIRLPVPVIAAPLRADTVRPKNGKTAFVDRTNTLVVTNANDSGRRRLARCPATITSCVISGYAWSPNGKQLALLRGHIGGAITASNLPIYAVNADGTSTRRLAHCGNCNPWSGLAWSPDNLSIVFAGEDGLHLISLVGGGQRRLTDTPSDVDPAWSPSGSRIVFARGNSL